MYLNPTFTSLALICSSVVLAAATPLASKHNIYLATCKRDPDCLLIICNAPPSTTAAAYYANGITNANRPSEFATVADPASPWEGASRKGKFRTATLSSAIDAGAKALAKGQIAGSATLGKEEFVCFRDGQSKFTTEDDDSTVNCVADYWCASTS